MQGAAYICVAAYTAIFPAKTMASKSEPYFMIDMISWWRSGCIIFSYLSCSSAAVARGKPQSSGR